MKNKALLGVLAGIVLAGCSTIKPTGHVDLVYIPARFDDHSETHELMTEIDVGFETNIKNVNLLFGGTQRMYMSPFYQGTLWIKPNRQEYDAYVKAGIEHFEFYAFHMFSPPVEDKGYEVYGEESDENNTNRDFITKLGVRFNF